MCVCVPFRYAQTGKKQKKCIYIHTYFIFIHTHYIYIYYIYTHIMCMCVPFCYAQTGKKRKRCVWGGMGVSEVCLALDFLFLAGIRRAAVGIG